MKFAAPLAALMLVAAPAFAQAQENSTPPADAPDHSEGTKPHNRGSTGWGGASKELEKTGSVSSSPKPGDAAGQPPLASGVDLKGPPQQFPPSKTPE